jgi:hypothetical protein
VRDSGWDKPVVDFTAGTIAPRAGGWAMPAPLSRAAAVPLMSRSRR